MRNAYKRIEMYVLCGLLLTAVFLVGVVLHGRRQAPDVMVEPQVYYSDWLSDMAPLEDWVAVAGSQERIVDWLKRIFEREGVPGALVWLAAVESGFDPRAVSARGAAGLFQLMPATSQRYGLRTRHPDERFDALRNSQTAARYLSDLYVRFGDWPLVLAAYNAGENRVARLTRLRGRHYEAIAPWLPSETRAFVPRVRALVEYHEACGLQEVRTPYRRYGGLLVADHVEP